jgi:AAA family ATP:ADP antiporter
MLSAAAVSGQFIAGKAVRDALFLTQFDVTALPVMVIVGSIVSILLVIVTSKPMARQSPATFLPLVFSVSAAALFAEWGLMRVAPRAATVLFYLQMLGLAPMLVSGFWSIVTERFDPRTARRNVGQIAAAGTFGGLVASLLADRLAAWASVPAILPALAGLNLWCAWLVRHFALRVGADGRPHGMLMLALGSEQTRSGLRVLRQTPYLRTLARLVLVSTLGAAFLDYVFKAQAVEALGRGDALLRFFAFYYASANLLSFVVQSSLTRLALEKLGLVLTTSTPSVAMLAGSAGAFLAPGLVSTTIARGSEFVARTSLLRSAYELFYVPVTAADKRAAKAIIDVGFDRAGEIAGGMLIRLVIAAAPAAQFHVLLGGTILCSAAALVLARQIHLGYVHTLEKSLISQAVHLDLAEVDDFTTRSIVLQTSALVGSMTEMKSAPSLTVKPPERPREPAPLPTFSHDPIVQSILALRSRDRERVLTILRQESGVNPALVPHIIPLLAWDAVATDAGRALQKVAEEVVGQLTDALIDPNQDFAVRRRLARVFSICVSQRAADGLMLGLEDRFEVRFQCGRSLAAIQESNPRIQIDRDRVMKIVVQEVSVSRPVWESHRLLDPLDEDQETQLVRDRSSQSLAHVFTLLSLVLHREPLQIAFRGLHTGDDYLRGTALEYLESVLPPEVRDRLWPFLEDRRPAARSPRSRDQILNDLLKSNQSVMLKLEDLRRKQDSTPGRASARQ